MINPSWHYSLFCAPIRGSGKYYTTYKSLKPSNKVYVLHIEKRSGGRTGRGSFAMNSGHKDMSTTREFFTLNKEAGKLRPSKELVIKNSEIILGYFEIMHTLTFFVRHVEVVAVITATCVTSNFIYAFPVFTARAIGITLINNYDNKKKLI